MAPSDLQRPGERAYGVLPCLARTPQKRGGHVNATKTEVYGLASRRNEEKGTAYALAARFINEAEIPSQAEFLVLGQVTKGNRHVPNSPCSAYHPAPPSQWAARDPDLRDTWALIPPLQSGPQLQDKDA